MQKAEDRRQERFHIHMPVLRLQREDGQTPILLHVRRSQGRQARPVGGHGFRGRFQTEEGTGGQEEEGGGRRPPLHPGLPLRARLGHGGEDGDPLRRVDEDPRGVHPRRHARGRGPQGGEDALRHAGPRVRLRDPSRILQGAISPTSSCLPCGGPRGPCPGASCTSRNSSRTRPGRSL